MGEQLRVNVQRDRCGAVARYLLDHLYVGSSTDRQRDGGTPQVTKDYGGKAWIKRLASLHCRVEYAAGKVGRPQFRT